MQCKSFVLPWIANEQHKVYTCSTKLLFLSFKKISKEAAKLGSFLQGLVHIFLGLNSGF